MISLESTSELLEHLRRTRLITEDDYHRAQTKVKANEDPFNDELQFAITRQALVKRTI